MKHTTRTCRLYHGPGAFEAALEAVRSTGRLLHEPLGAKGLTADEARFLVDLMQSPPLGDQLGVLVAGPLDHAAPKSTDVLLKTIEEPPPYIIPILWATDLGGVSATIRSRCLPIWAPLDPHSSVVDEEIEGLARDLLQAVLAGHYWQVPIVVGKVKATTKQRSREPELVAEVLDAMSSMLDNPKVFSLWESVRALACWRNPTPLELIAAFMPDEVG